MAEGRIVRVSPERDPNYGLRDDDDAEARAEERASRKKDGEDPSPEELEDIEADKRARAAPDGAGADDGHAEAERKARTLGWVPENEWTGRPDRWMPAEDWLDKGYANRGILQSLNDKLVGDVQRLEALNRDQSIKLDEMGKVVHDIYGRFERADQVGYNRAKAELERQKREAVNEADSEKYDRAEAELKNLRAPPPPRPAPNPTLVPVAAGPDPVIAAWTAENRYWFEKRLTDPELEIFLSNTNKELLAHYDRIGTASKVTSRQHLDEIAKMARKQFPQYFEEENPRRSARGSVSRPSGDRLNGNGSRRDSGGVSGHTYNDLDQEARDACDRMCRTLEVYDQKTGELRKFKVDDYLRTYDWDAL